MTIPTAEITPGNNRINQKISATPNFKLQEKDFPLKLASRRQQCYYASYSFWLVQVNILL